MFEDLRKHSSWIVIVIAAVFILSMAIGGITSAFIKKPFVAEINGDKIHPQDYQLYIERSFSNYAQTNPGQQIDDKTSAQLREETWKQVVDEYLINQELKKNRIKITDKDILAKLKDPSDDIKAIPQFQVDGKFDQDTYITMLTEDERFASILENQIRATLPVERLYAKIKAEVRVTEDDVREDYIEKNNIADAKIIYFNSSKITDVEATDAELEKYYNDHKEDYKKGPARKMRYINLKLTPSESDKAEAEKRSHEIYDEVMKGGDFAEIAIAKSEGPSAPKGGDLGYFTKDRMVKPFAETAFAMKVGDISKPVVTDFGWHIIKVYDIKTNDKKQKEVKASHILIKPKASDATKEAFTQRKEDIYAAAKKDGVEKAAEAFGEQSSETKDFYEDATYIGGLGNDKALINFAFKNKVGNVYDLIEKEDAATITEISFKIGDHYQELADVKSAIERSVKKEKKIEAVQKQAEEFIAATKEVNYFTAAEKAEWDIVEKTDLIATASISKIGKDEELNKAILAKSADEFTGLIKTEKGAYIAFISKRVKPDMDKFQKDLESITKSFTEAKETEHLNEWYRTLKENAEIIDNRAQFFN